MNMVSTATVLPRTPTDINGFLSVIFIGPKKFDARCFGSLFQVCKQKVWKFLIWLCHHNPLYASIPLDSDIMSLYPEDGPMPGLDRRVVEDRELNADCVFHLETVGFVEHPSSLCIDSSKNVSDHSFMVEKMGGSDPESNKLAGRNFVASAIRNLLPKDTDKSCPDLVIHHTAQPVMEYHNPSFFPGLFPTLFPYGIGGFEIKTHSSALAFKQQAKY
jgi:hypothetical protein